MALEVVADWCRSRATSNGRSLYLARRRITLSALIELGIGLLVGGTPSIFGSAWIYMYM